LILNLISQQFDYCHVIFHHVMKKFEFFLTAFFIHSLEVSHSHHFYVGYSLIFEFSLSRHHINLIMLNQDFVSVVDPLF